MQFRWTDISNVDQPGTYLLPNDTRIKIDAKHIVMWTHDPDGVFDAFLYPGDKKRAAEYTLTDFHPSEDLGDCGGYQVAIDWRPRAQTAATSPGVWNMAGTVKYSTSRESEMMMNNPGQKDRPAPWTERERQDRERARITAITQPRG